MSSLKTSLRGSIVTFLPRYNLGNVSFIAVAGILVFFMVPGVGESVPLMLIGARSTSLALPRFSIPLFRTVATEERTLLGVGSSCK